MAVCLIVASQTNPQFFPIMADAEFDSFLTIGMDGPALIPGALSTIGIDFTSWTESTGIRTDNGAVRALVFRRYLLHVAVAVESCGIVCVGIFYGSRARL